MRPQVLARPPEWKTTLIVVLLLAGGSARASAQSVTISTVGDEVHVRASGLGFIKGETLARLKDGRAVRVDLELSVLAKPGAAPATQTRQTFILSYDLWDERFAVNRAGSPPRSISNQTAAGAEAWCVEQLSVPASALGSLGRAVPLWVRLEYRILDSDAAPASDDGEGLTLRWLIDTLSRRRKADAPGRAIEAGPLRLPE